jgi:biopolymer transport protein ExbB
MWSLIIERLWFFRSILPRRIATVTDEWQARPDQQSWNSHSIRAQLISEVTLEARRNTGTIQVLMAILPLLGLLGTVTGMIQVFSVMAVAGTSNARLMAGGVSAATIPTMAGLVAALSGLYLAVYLKRRAEKEVQSLEDLLVYH